MSRLWQIHVFAEGNTRTTAVFFIKYLRTLGFDVQNDIFAEYAWFFRNALVRANYNNLRKNVHETTEYLEMFLRNLLLDEDNELSNRAMHISGCMEKADKKPIKADKKPIKADREQLIVKYIEQNGSISNKEARELLGLAESTTKRVLKAMVGNGLLIKHGERKGRRYYLK